MDTKPSIDMYSTGPSEREKKLLKGFNAKKEEIMKKGRKGYKGDKSSIWILIR